MGKRAKAGGRKRAKQAKKQSGGTERGEKRQGKADRAKRKQARSTGRKKSEEGGRQGKAAAGPNDLN